MVNDSIGCPIYIHREKEINYSAFFCNERSNGIMEIKSELISNSKDLEIVKRIWNQLQTGKEMTAFQSYEWNVLLAEEYFSNRYNRILSVLKVYYVVDSGKPLILLPVIVQKHSMKVSWLGREKGIYILGVGSYSDYLNAIYVDFNLDAFKLLLSTIKNENKQLPVYINYLREDTSVHRYLLENGISEIKRTKSAYINLSEDSEKYNDRLSKNTKQNLRTALNRMNRDEMNYELQCLVHLENEDDIMKLIWIHRKRLTSKAKKHDTGSIHVISRIMRNKRRLMYNYDIVENSMRRLPQSYFIIVKLKGVIVSYLYGLRDDRAIRIMHNCFDEDYKFYSPMFRGAYDFILDQTENRALNVDQIDFTRGDEEYKFKLGAEELPLYHYAL